MPEVARIQSVLTGVAGSPAYSTMHFTDITNSGEAVALAGIVRTFWTAAMPAVRAGVTWTLNPDIGIYDVATGERTGAFSTGVIAPITGAGGSTQSPAVNCEVQLRCSDYVNGRSPRGKIYIPYLNSDGTEAGGVASAAIVTALNAAIATVIAAGPALVVYSRPFPGSLTKPPRAGTTSDVTSGVTQKRLAILRSRRD